MLFLRALVAFVTLPGMVAGLIPWLIVSSDGRANAGWFGPGVALLAAGLAVLLWCVRDFYVAGKGTLAPWDPPARFVRIGLYRVVRNPMYVGVLLLVVGWAVLSASPALVIYGLVLALAFHARVTMYEEPWLARNFPDEWRRYSASVPRWLPRVRRRMRSTN
jgi:protein-S-isoprenylcysteine O-methyltransferase Ste14